MEAFCLYKNGNSDDDKILTIENALISCGFESIFSLANSDAVERDLFESEILVIFVANDNDFSERTLSDRWRYFQNEIRWKRKERGDILLVLDEGVDNRRIPLTLRGLPQFDFSLGQEALENKIDEVLNSEAKARIIALRECAGEAELIAAANRAKQQKLDQNGCEKDHVFESATKVRTPYLERLAEILEKKKEKAAQDKANKGGINEDLDEIDRAIDNIAKDAKVLDNEAKNASLELNDAAERLRNDEIKLTFSDSNKSYSMQERDDASLTYKKGDEYQSHSYNENDPFGGKYNHSYNKKNNDKKKNESTLAALFIGGIFFFIFLMFLINL